jgi:hypothetical protein
MEINNKLKINEYVSLAQLKRKLKAYLAEQGNSDFKPSIFAQGIVVSLVMVLEELVGDCLKSVSKEKSGLYTINQLILSNLFGTSDKYDFVSRYMKKYSSTLRYHESVFFNISKVISGLEDKHGSKLMIDSDAKNIICYIILSLQYDIVELSVNMVKYAGRKTLNVNVLDIVCSYILSNDISNKIKLKLDSINISTNEEVEEVEDENDGNENDGNENNSEPISEPVSEPIKEVVLETIQAQEETIKEKKRTKEIKEIVKEVIESKTENSTQSKISKELVEDIKLEEKTTKKSKSKSK